MPTPPVPTIDVFTAADLLAAPSDGTPPPLLVDVREADEYLAVRAQGAVLMPLSTFLLKYQELPRDRPLLMICAAGGRSAAASGHLLASGWQDVTNIAGGTIAWQRSGLPIRHGPLAPGEGDLPR